MIIKLPIGKIQVVYESDNNNHFKLTHIIGPKKRFMEK